KGGSTNHVDVGADLGREHRRDVRRLNRVLQLVLPVRGAELEPTDHLGDLGVEPWHASLVSRRLALLADLLLDLLLGLRDDLFDARWMNAPVLDEFRQRQASDLSSNWIKA